MTQRKSKKELMVSSSSSKRAKSLVNDEPEVIEGEVIDEAPMRDRVADSEGIDEEQRVYAPWVDPRTEEPIDAEVIEESAADSEEYREYMRVNGEAKGRSRFYKNLHEHFVNQDSEEDRQGRNERIEIDLDREAWEAKGLPEREQLLKMRSESRLHGERYLQSLRDSNLLGDPSKGMQDLTGMRKIYTMMMVQSCLGPLRNGLGAATMIQAAGMFTAMQMVDKDFRVYVGQYLDPIRDKIQERRDARTHRHTDGRDEDRLSARWTRRMEDLKYRERGHRDMFTTESAALTEMGLAENAFREMREPGADVDKTDKKYRAMRTHLLRQMDDDGLDRDEVRHAVRTMVGDRMETEPELRTMYVAPSHGRAVKSAPHEEMINGKKRMAWTGEYETQTGIPLVFKEGGFMARRPQSDEEHRTEMTAVMQEAITCSLKRDFSGDSASLTAQDLTGYVMGFQAYELGHTYTEDEMSFLKENNSDMYKRMDECRTMLGSMYADNIPQDRRQDAYSSAFIDAINGVRDKNDEKFMSSLHFYFGKDWEAGLKDAVQDPAGWHRQAQTKEAMWDFYTTKKQPFTPDPPTAPKDGPTRPQGDEPELV